MDKHGNIRELQPGERMREDEIDVTGLGLDSLNRKARKAYWRAIRQGLSSKAAIARARKVDGEFTP